MHVYLWDAKAREMYTLPLSQHIGDKGILLTAKPWGFQPFDGWIGYQSPSLLQQLSQTDPRTDLGKFTAKRLPPAFVTCSRHCERRCLGAMPPFLGVHGLYPFPFVTASCIAV